MAVSRSITLSLLKYLEDNQLGTIDKDLFWEKLGLGKIGCYITDLGGSYVRGARRSTAYQIFSRGKNDLDGLLRLQKIVDFINNSGSQYVLPAVLPYTNEGFACVYLEPLGAIASNGEDGDGRVIYSVTGRVYY